VTTFLVYWHYMNESKYTPKLMDIVSPRSIVVLLSLSALLPLLSLLTLGSPLLGVLVALTAWLVALIPSPWWLLVAVLAIRTLVDGGEYWFTITLGSFTVSAAQYLGVLIPILTAVVLLRARQRIFVPRVFVLYGSILVIGLASLAWSISPTATASDALRLVSILCIALLVPIAITSVARLEGLFWSLVIVSVAPSAVALAQVALGIGISDDAVAFARPFATFSHPNTFALYLVFTIMAAGFLWLRFRSFGARTFLTLLILTQGLLLLLTYTRIAWLSLALSGTLALWHYRRVWLVPLVLLASLVFLVPSIQNRVLEIFDTQPSSSTSWRQGLWTDMYAKIRFDDREFLGNGFATFTLYAEDFRGSDLGSVDPHNDFIRFGVELGVLGVVLLSVVWVGIFRTLRRAYRTSAPGHDYIRLAWYTTLGIFLASFSDNLFRDTILQWYLIIFTVVAEIVPRLSPKAAKKGSSTPLYADPLMRTSVPSNVEPISKSLYSA